MIATGRSRARWAALGWLGAGALVLLAAASAGGVAGDGGAPTHAGTADAGPPTTVRIVFQTVPPEKGAVYWGRKRLGILRGPRRPLILERPRDSGPMDVVVKVPGFLDVHTRAHTFSDSKLFVRLTPVTEKRSLFGYREELPDAGPDGTPIAGQAGPSGDGGTPLPAIQSTLDAAASPLPAPTPLRNPAPFGPPLR